MQIKQNSEQIIISIPNNADAFGKQKLIEYAKYLELTDNKKVFKKEADKFAEETTTVWWKKNKKHFVKT
ncbi:MAG: hypothetical protein IPM95_11565 [Sphingobacteriales bacterium]|jgi:hypothetical protein|nr:hypothetical protein [Sphingobacteriales bacterium]